LTIDNFGKKEKLDFLQKTMKLEEEKSILMLRKKLV
jgi:hypothetical protein